MPTVTSSDITPADLRHRLLRIAHDSMLGRASGSEGNYKTAQYIAAEFKRLGLEPAGDSGSYFQTVPFWSVAVDPRSWLEVRGERLVAFRDFLPLNGAAPPITLTNAAVIFGGSVADTTRVIGASEVAGKLVVLDVPPGANPRPLGNARWRGAVGIAVVYLEQFGSDNLARLREGQRVPDTSRLSRATPVLLVSRHAATLMLGADPSTVSPSALGSAVTGRFDFERTSLPYPARNVVAVLPGSDPSLRGQYVALSAHNDHLGFDQSPADHDSLRAFNRVMRPFGTESPRRTPTAEDLMRIRRILDSLRSVNPPRLDSIRNGADDDGSGTVAVLEIAEKLASGPRPRRSVLFVSHTGEEDGLLGSRWFTSHATVPIDSIVAEIDEDMIGRDRADDSLRAGRTVALEVIGSRRLSREFGDSLEAANARQPLPFVFDYSYDAPGHPQQHYCRADHYSYARYGIPAVVLSRGVHPDYHQVTDEAQYIDYDNLARVAKMVYTATLVVGNMSRAPQLDAPKQPPDRPCIQ